MLQYSPTYFSMENVNETKISEATTSMRCFLRKGVLKNFAKFKGKHLRWKFFSNKAAGRPATLLK